MRPSQPTFGRKIFFCACFGFLLLTKLNLPAADAKLEASLLTNLIFDAEVKLYDAQLEETTAPFKFSVTNRWTNELTVDRVKTSCGCTVASLPANPWHIPAGGHGEVAAVVNLEGKPPGLMTKTLTFFVSANSDFIGSRMVTVKVNIPKAPAPAALSAEERKAAMAAARLDAQKIFKDPQCAECHVNPGRHLQGALLYAADCGICHDSPNRESSVPDLRALKIPTPAAYWRAIITDGKPNSLMPGFALARGGPLDEEQIHSLVEYLGLHFKPN